MFLSRAFQEATRQNSHHHQPDHPYHTIYPLHFLMLLLRSRTRPRTWIAYPIWNGPYHLTADCRKDLEHTSILGRPKLER